MQKYFETKDQYPGCILFYRLGDFYEMFFDDAITASKALEITLTGKECGLEERAPMCGVPFHAADNYTLEIYLRSTCIRYCLIQKKITLKKKKSYKIKAELQPITASDKVTFTSSNKKVATVNAKGVVKAKKAGTAKITVKAGKKKAIVTVKVK